MRKLGVWLFVLLVSLASGGPAQVAPQAGPTTTTIALAVYRDKNGNGTREKGEPLLKWGVALHQLQDGAVVWSHYTTTSPAPAVWLAESGTYLAEAAVPPADSNWYNTTPAEAAVTLAAGQHGVTVYFGVNRTHVKVP